jgi:hypothetical protein
MPVDSSSSLILGSIVGLSLAFAQFLFSSFLSSKAVSTSLLRSEMVMLFGFLFKLIVLGLIFFGLSRVPALHFVAMLISFLIGVTGLLVWRVRSNMCTSAHGKDKRNASLRTL